MAQQQRQAGWPGPPSQSGAPPNFGPMQPGQQPTPQQIQQMQQQIAAEAQKAGLTIPQYIERVKAQAMQNEDKNNRALQNAYNTIDTWADAEHLTHGVKNLAKSF